MNKPRKKGWRNNPLLTFVAIVFYLGWPFLLVMLVVWLGSILGHSTAGQQIKGSIMTLSGLYLCWVSRRTYKNGHLFMAYDAWQKKDPRIARKKTPRNFYAVVICIALLGIICIGIGLCLVGGWL